MERWSIDENKFIFWIVLFCIGLTLMYFVRLGNAPTGNIGQLPSLPKTLNNPEGVDIETNSVTNDCGQVTSSCIAGVKLKAKKCKAKSITQEAEDLLQDPLSNVGCQDIHQQLAEMCSASCEIDPVSLLIVPGKIDYKVLDQPDLIGDCQIAAEKGVSIRANCILKK